MSAWASSTTARRRRSGACQEQGDRVGAQRILFDAYSSGLSKAAEVTSAWGRVSEAVHQFGE